MSAETEKKEFEKQSYKPLAVVQALETCKELAKIFNEILLV